ncbi:restriction endonuclease S subunit [Actinoalloteichus hoggarensis]|nr:restriction endonuclease S subunit [Actinoalloteichus hoggarensis]
MARYRLLEDDIVCTRTGDLGRYGRVGAVQEGWLLGPGCMRIRHKPGPRLFDAGYLTQYLSGPEAATWLERNATGSVIKNISTGLLSRMPVVLPPLPEQRRIGEALAALDSEMELYGRFGAAVAAVRDRYVERLM